MDDGAELLAGRCSHRVRGTIGAWSGRPPNIRGYALCESCCAEEKILLARSGPAVPLHEALSTALDAHRPGKHSADRQPAKPRQDAAETTERLPVLRAIDVEEWPASDPDVKRVACFAVPGSRYLPGTANEPTGRLAGRKPSVPVSNSALCS